MKTTNWKARISLLWVLLVITMLAQIQISWSAASFQRVFWFVDPATGIVQTSCVLMGLAVFLLIPLVMAYLTVTLRSLVNRLLNLVLGVVYAGLTIANIVTSFSRSAAGSLSQVPIEPLGAQILLAFATLIGCILIIAHAWMSPKRERQMIDL